MKLCLAENADKYFAQKIQLLSLPRAQKENWIAAFAQAI